MVNRNCCVPGCNSYSRGYRKIWEISGDETCWVCTISCSSKKTAAVDVTPTYTQMDGCLSFHQIDARSGIIYLVAPEPNKKYIHIFITALSPYNSHSGIDKPQIWLSHRCWEAPRFGWNAPVYKPSGLAQVHIIARFCSTGCTISTFWASWSESSPNLSLCRGIPLCCR